MNGAPLVADSIAKAFRGRKVLAAAALRAEAGMVTALVGRNGTGKSTLLRIVAGRLRADHCVLDFSGRRYLRLRLVRLARDGLFYLPDHDILSPAFTVREQLEAAALRFDGMPVDEAARLTGISSQLDQRPPSLSGGELRRAEIALALVRGPSCLLADEPFRGIAPVDTDAIGAALRHLATQGATVVCSGHEVATLLAIADRVIWCADGTTYHLGTVAEAREDWRFRREYLGVG
jgi:ABC-type multidrug transport system ATPase subunit